MLSIINPFQGAFFAGRSAHDNIAMAQELMHSIRNSKKRHGNLAIRINLAKAYDRVDWSILRETLSDFGFPSSIICRIILSCVSESFIYIYHIQIFIQYMSWFATNIFSQK